jgi:hypothetical protein
LLGGVQAGPSSGEDDGDKEREETEPVGANAMEEKEHSN